MTEVITPTVTLVPTEPPAKAIVLPDLYAMIKSPELTWEPMRPGVEIHRLYRWQTGQSAALLRYAPGASLSAHRHVAFEHIFVLSGTQTDQNGTHHPGTLLIHPPGTRHSIVTQTGCTVLAIWEQPVVFDEETR
jgi:anti-sigma factor ChrR (cupin superfamily)